MPELKHEATEAERALQKFLTARYAEINALRTCFDALAPLAPDAKRRVTRWIDDGAIYTPALQYSDEPPF